MIKTITKYDWQYSIDENNKFHVEPSSNDKKRKPETLFKYYDLSRDSLDAISHSYLYAPHPDQLNDPFDCSEEIIRMDIPQVMYGFMFHGGNGTIKYNNENISPFQVKQLIESKDVNFMKFVHYNFKLINYSFHGIISMIDCPENILMWSYYNKHRGICIEFDYEQFPYNFQGPFQINYQDIIEPYSLKEHGKNMLLAFLYQSNVKVRQWGHESEWRFIVQSELQMKMSDIDDLKYSSGVERKFPYSRKSLKSVTLGNRFFHNTNERPNQKGEIILKENIEQRKLILGIIINQEIPVYIIGRKRDTFELKRVPIKIDQLEENKFKMYQIGSEKINI